MTMTDLHLSLSRLLKLCDQLSMTSQEGRGVFTSDGRRLKNDRTFLTFLALQINKRFITN